MYLNRIEVSFDAGHRLLGYPGKCASPHGHTYSAEVFVISPELNELGLAVDFRELKGRCEAWIDEHWDHGFLLNDRDTQLIDALRSIPEAKLYLFADLNPSAEAMARELYRVAEQPGWRVQRVRIWESPNQFGEYANDEVPMSVGTVQEALA